MLCAPLLAASEEDAYDRDSDLRLVIGAAPGITKATINDAQTSTGAADPAAEGSTTYSPEDGPWYEIDLMTRSPRENTLGWVAGAGFFFTWARGSFTTPSAVENRKVTAYGLTVSAGPSLQFDWVRLELLPMGAIGTAEGQDEEVTSSMDLRDNSHHGLYYSYGGRVGLYADNKNGLIGLQAGWQAFSSKMSFPNYTTRVGSTDTVSGSGLFIGFLAGVAF